MKKKKTICIIITTIIFTIIIVGCVMGYFIYGSTMIDINDEKSIINHLSTDKDNPINILSTKKYGDCFLIVYTDPVETGTNEFSSRFSCFTKHKFYKNRYEYKGGTTGNQTEIMVSGIELDNEVTEENSVVYAIANVASNETKCSVFEVSPETGTFVDRLDVIDVPQGQPYILVKEYKIKSKDNLLIVYDGEIELKQLTEVE